MLRVTFSFSNSYLLLMEARYCCTSLPCSYQRIPNDYFVLFSLSFKTSRYICSIKSKVYYVSIATLTLVFKFQFNSHQFLHLKILC